MQEERNQEMQGEVQELRDEVAAARGELVAFMGRAEGEKVSLVHDGDQEGEDDVGRFEELANDLAELQEAGATRQVDDTQTAAAGRVEVSKAKLMRDIKKQKRKVANQRKREFQIGRIQVMREERQGAAYNLSLERREWSR